MAPLYCSHLELRGWIPPEMVDLPRRVLTGRCLGSVGLVGMGVWFHPGLPILFSCLAASIFSLKEIQLQKDPGYRGLAFQHPGRATCSSPHPIPFARSSQVEHLSPVETLLRERNGPRVCPRDGKSTSPPHIDLLGGSSLTQSHPDGTLPFIVVLARACPVPCVLSVEILSSWPVQTLSLV